MSIFYKTFDRQVREELEYRKQFRGLQQVLIPHLRVTSLVEAKDFRIEGLDGATSEVIDIVGLTLGPVRTDLANFLEDQVNISATKTVVGMTYPEGVARKVAIPSSKVNLPSPGVESANIDVYKGGLAYKVTLNLRCYGKEQYDFLYQFFTRPGCPILVEYGHTRNDKFAYRNDAANLSGFVDLSDLGDQTFNLQTDGDPTIIEGFFDRLTKSKIETYNQMLSNFRGPLETRSSGAVVGLVTNFDVKLNQNNEYEITLELINGLEWFYNIQNDNTFISYDQEGKYDSKSIRLSFGIGEGEEYKPYTDTILRYVFAEIERAGKEIQDNKAFSRAPRAFRFITTVETEDNKVRTRGLDIMINDPRLRGQDRTSEIIDQKATIERTTEAPYEIGDFTAGSELPYVSLDWFLKELLDKILNTSYQDIVGVYNQFKGRRKFFGSNTEARTFFKNAGQIDTQNRSTITNIKTFLSPESYCTYWKDLRSTKPYVVFNNATLYKRQNDTYSKYFHEARWKDYAKKYDIAISEDLDGTSLTPLFSIDPDLKHRAELYGESEAGDGERQYSFKGIYINYERIRNAFMESDTLAQAIVKILNYVNVASGGVLKLKMKFLNSNVESDRDRTENPRTQNNIPDNFNRYELVIYDEATLPTEVEDPYTFFEDDISEAISYDLQFNLPSSVASVIVASDWQNKYASGGDLTNKMFVDYGYTPGITKLIGQSQNPPPDSEQAEKVKPIEEYAINDKSGFESFLDSIEADVGVNSLLGYLELTPPAMTRRLILSGLNNTLPSAARISITLQGIAGIKIGQLFKVKNILPGPYDKWSIFWVVGYEHNISSEGWETKIEGQLISSNPNPRKLDRPAVEYPEDKDIQPGEEKREEVEPPRRQPDEETGSDAALAKPLLIEDLPPNNDEVLRDLDLKMVLLFNNVRKELEVTDPDLYIRPYSTFRERNTFNPNNESASINSKHFLRPAKALDYNIYRKLSNGKWIFYSKISATLGNPDARAIYAQVGNLFIQMGRRMKMNIESGHTYSKYDPNHIELED